MKGKFEYTKEAQDRIAIAKRLAMETKKLTQGRIGRQKAEWHIYTIREDNNNDDPYIFNIMLTSHIGKAYIGVRPKLRLARIIFQREFKEILVEEARMPIPDKVKEIMKEEYGCTVVEAQSCNG